MSRLAGLLPLSAALLVAACGAEEAAEVTTETDLTSASSVERTLTLKGYVHVEKSASSSAIDSAVKRQIRTAFGPLRIAKISVDDRELKNNVDPAGYVTTELDLVRRSGTGGGGDTGTDLTEGGPNAKGVVKVANDPAVTEDVFKSEMKLSSLAATNLVAGRPYSTVAQVDAVKGIGSWSLQQLLAYAKAHGHVEGSGGATVTVLRKVRRVEYTYRARALVEKSLASKTSFGLALLMGDYQSFVSEILQDCVESYEHDQEFASSFWYVWFPGASACKTRIDSETQAIQSERQGLVVGQLGELEFARRYLPVNAQLDPAAGPRTTYPEYDQLYGLNEPGKKDLVVYQIVGVASHDGDPESDRFANDLGFAEFFKTLKVLADRWPSLKVSSASSVDPLTVTFNGQSYSGTFGDLYSWVVNRSGFPAGIASSDRDAFRRAIHDHVLLKWIRLEVPLTVRSGQTSRQLTLQLRLLFGTESSWSVRSYFKEAFKNGDVVLYDGHSYIGSGPLDPGNYSPSDFAGRYQIFFFNSCVSFNYYSVDYFDHKAGGSKNLDLVTNGVEVWIQDGGKSMGQFIVALLDGKQNTWLDVLKKTQISTYYGVHDPNRAVDGEQDNLYDPAATPISVSEGWSNALTVSLGSTACGATASNTVGLTATAPGASRVELYAGGALVASDSSEPFSASWDTTTVANGPVTLTARAFASDGQTAEASCQTTVQNGGAQLFFDDMEGGAAGWTASGLWHLAQGSTCAVPAASSGSRAWYFGQSSGCNYKTGAAVKGTLTSASIAGVTASSTVSFQYLRRVESTSSGSYDRTTLEVSSDGSTWKSVWSRDSRDASTSGWQSSGELSLAAYAGKSIQLRFSFDSVDSYSNDNVGWLVDDVRVK